MRFVRFVVASLFFGWSILSGYQWLANSTFFVIKYVHVVGNRSIARRSIAGPSLIGQHILNIDLEALSAKIMSVPGIENVFLKRTLPGTLNIVVQEFEPRAIHIGTQLSYINHHGHVYRPVAVGEDLNLLAITGIPANQPEQLQKALEFAKQITDNGAINKLFNEGISEVHHDPMDGFSVVLVESGIKIILGQRFEAIHEQRLTRIKTDMKRQNKEITYVNLNFKDRAIVGLALAINEGGLDGKIR